MMNPSSASAGRIPVPPPRDEASVVVVTGLSGAGKTLALKAFEDMGYEAVDNLPLSLLSNVVRRGEGPRRPLAVGIDIRTRNFGVEPVRHVLDALRKEGGVDARLVFIDCEDEVLRRRFTETRRRHPLAIDRPLTDGIRRERQLVLPLRDRADLVIDTSSLPPGEFKRLLEHHFSPVEDAGLGIFVSSFAYRRGVPREADLVFDVRFLNNPHYDPVLRPKTGRDGEVADFITSDPAFPVFFDNLSRLLEPLLPRFEAEGKSYLTIAIGCTGGRHRSVFVAERLARWLTERGARVELRHRELDGEPPSLDNGGEPSIDKGSS
ncbi:MAG: RNase adapter RapZ [Alphaproteobacteria bacterium]|nr:RNase adapter RapZ [Alphaproteobacteria bacterium]MBF0128975.1 RNase adapter RapZ [Alphaproteobacteria bacterium]